jgi:hypothetical protein
MGPSRGPLIPPLMGPSTPPSMGPPGGEGAVGAGLGLFQQVRALRYVGVRPIDSWPVDGLPSSAHSGRNRGGRTIQPALRAGRAFARNPRKPGCGHATNLAFNCRIIFQHCWRLSCPDAHRPPTCRLGHRNDPPTMRSDAAGMASTPRVMPADQLGSCGRLASHLARRHGT